MSLESVSEFVDRLVTYPPAAGATATSRAVSFRERSNCREAARLMAAGYTVGAFVRTTCGIWIDGSSAAGVDAVYRIKGQKRVGRPFSMLLDAPRFVARLDPDQLAPALHDIFLDPDKLAARLGDLCFIRAPITAAAAGALPEELWSRTPDGTFWLQNWVGCDNAPALMLLEEMAAQGTELPVATSMNVSGQPEIVDQEDGAQFCREHDIPLFLHDPAHRGHVQGSYPIISIDHDGVHLLRHGHFPGELFRYLLDGLPVTLEGARPATYPLVPTHDEATAATLDGPTLRCQIAEALAC